MSTHVLSRKVNISGKLVDDKYFNFDLNREATNVHELQDNLEKSFELFDCSSRNENYNDGEYDTIFTYELSESSLQIAEDGIRQLNKILPFVLAFNEKIQDIDVLFNDETVSIKRGNKEEIKLNDNLICLQEILHTDHSSYIVFVKSLDSDIAVLLDKEDDKYCVVDISDDYPKLFSDFPLFGTEKFGCPVIINSSKFDLQEKRDGIYLRQEDKDHPTIAENKKIINDSLNSLGLLIKVLTDKQSKGIYNLFRFTIPFEYNWLQKEWLVNLYRNKINDLLETECLKLNDKAFKLNSLVIPYSSNLDLNQFYNLVTEIIQESIPIYDEVIQWIKIAKDYSIIENKNLVSYYFIIDENKLCQYIEEKKTLFEISKSIDKDNIYGPLDLAGTIKWFGNYFGLLTKEQTVLLSNKYNIIPNQNYILVKREPSKPLIDGIGDEKIKNVAASFGWDIKSELVYSGIDLKDGILLTVNLKYVLDKIQLLSNGISDEQLSEINKRKALIYYFQWLMRTEKKNI